MRDRLYSITNKQTSNLFRNNFNNNISYSKSGKTIKMSLSGAVLNNIRLETKSSITPEQLSYMAFNGDYASVYTYMRKLPDNERSEFVNKNVLFETIAGSLEKLSHLKNLHNDELIQKEKEFLLENIELFIKISLESKLYPRRLFESIVKVAEELVQLSEFDSACFFLKASLNMGINKFPELRTEVFYKLAHILNTQGNLTESEKYINKLLLYPYMINDRNKIAELLFKVCQINLKKGNIDDYKCNLFLGLRFFYTSLEYRKKIFKLLKNTYRNLFILLRSRQISLTNRVIFLIHWFYFLLPDLSNSKLRFIQKINHKVLLGIIYLFNYSRKAESVKAFLRFENGGNYSLKSHNSSLQINSNSKRFRKEKKILITRAVGGIGDLLTMTPGFHALKNKFPKHEIYLAIPRRYFPVFEGNPDVKLLDIESDFFSHFEYSRWYNFTDCPAARKESISAPEVKKSRIEIFAEALGIHAVTRAKMDKRPMYYINDSERKFADEHWKKLNLNGVKVVGIQLRSDETYRDYPFMEELVLDISQKYKVLLFDVEAIQGFQFENVIKVQGLSLRRAFALAHKCDAIVAPDSSFVHFAAAYNIPTIGLFGPIDGRVRTKHYPNCTYLDSKQHLGCIPCWRNENIPCKLTGMKVSECMKGIPVKVIVNELDKKLIKGDCIV